MLTSLMTNGTRKALYNIFGLRTLPAPRVFIASRTRPISPLSMGTKDMEMSMPSVIARGVCTCERLRVILTVDMLIPISAQINNPPSLLTIESAESQLCVTA